MPDSLIPGTPIADTPIADTLAQAIEAARAAVGEMQWLVLGPRERTAAIYHHLCRLDSGCQRVGGPSDMLLPPCRAANSFIARRACRAAWPRRLDGPAPAR